MRRAVSWLTDDFTATSIVTSTRGYVSTHDQPKIIYQVYPRMLTHKQDLALSTTITGDHSKWNQILLVNKAKYISLCMYRRSYLVWSPVILDVV